MSWRWRVYALSSMVGLVLLVVLLGKASTAQAEVCSTPPLKVCSRQAGGIYGQTLAVTRVYATVNARRSGWATVSAEGLDTSHGNWSGSEGRPDTARQWLHKGRNRVHVTVFAQRFEDRFCAWQNEADHPECPFFPAFRHDPYVRVAVPLNRVFVSLSVAGSRRLDRVASIHESSGAAAASTARPPDNRR